MNLTSNVASKLADVQYDVCVVGAGPSGSAVAYFLAKGGLRVALLDKFDFPRDKTCGDGLTPRAIKMLDAMGILPQIEETAFNCPNLKIRYSDELSFYLDLDHLNGLPNYILTVPRFQLDDVLRKHAVSAGAEFIPRAKVETIRRAHDRRVQIEMANGHTIECVLAVLATGANTNLQQRIGLLNKTPPVNLAARAYFENIDGLEQSITLFFDGVELPGYGWVFPTGERTANVGCGVFFESHAAQTSRLRSLIEEHPLLQRLLRNARQVTPIKGYPLLTNFSPSSSGSESILVVGEAVGLVNPVTGEGIDYALESAQLAASTILNEWHGGILSTATQKKYRAALRERFQLQLMASHLLQKMYFRDEVWHTLLKSASQKPSLRNTMMELCFGIGNPFKAFSPKTLMEIFLP